VWEYSQSRLAASRELAALAAGGPPGVKDREREPIRDTTEHLRLRLAKWCETAVEKITEEMEDLEMHTAVRNVMRLFDRIRDFEKRVLARQGQLSPADSDALIDALVVLVRLLGPFAPHLAEELSIALAGEEQSAQMSWPGVSFQVPA
jgi:leucyl-tRNA synthetase